MCGENRGDGVFVGVGGVEFKPLLACLFLLSCLLSTLSLTSFSLSSLHHFFKRFLLSVPLSLPDLLVLRGRSFSELGLLEKRIEEGKKEKGRRVR